MDIREANKEAWNRLVQNKNRWTVPVSPEEISRARKGDWALLLTPSKSVPKSWFPELFGLTILCLAGGGGQQGPILAAAGAEVTVFDNSPLQLAQDRLVAEREGLSLKTVEGDMKDLGAFKNDSFDMIFHPCSNGFSETILPVWKESFRVLKPNGNLLSGFSNPLIYLFDPELEKQNILQLRFSVPYSDLESITPEERERYFPDEPLSFGHSLEDQIGGQIDAGFKIIGFYEDDWGQTQLIDKYIKGFIATRALK
jgi:SAM-dependent methyltransferase